MLEISTQAHSQKTRIAVIDTGIDKDDPNAEEVSDYRDFIDGNDGIKVDDTGHGTAIIDLIYRVYEPAEIFVARVLSTPERNERIRADCLVAKVSHLPDLCVERHNKSSSRLTYPPSPSRQ